MAPQRDTYIFSENSPEITFKYIPRKGATNSQLIIQKTVNDMTYGYNFNAEDKNRSMGYIEKGMGTLFNIPKNRWYNRHISNDCSMLQITEMTENEKNNYLNNNRNNNRNNNHNNNRNNNESVIRVDSIDIFEVKEN